jgi:hypothetical protein
MGLTTQRATCRSCLKRGLLPFGTKQFLGIALLAGLLLALLLALAAYLLR